MQLRTTILALAVLAAAGGVASFMAGTQADAHAEAAGAPGSLIAVIPPGQVDYYATAESLVDGKPVSPARLTAVFAEPLHIMKRQVSQAEYAQCVEAGACKALDKAQRGNVSEDLPVVGVSWVDATRYASWYSQHTGRSYRLPTYAEWAHAAGEGFKEDLLIDVEDSNNPARRWLAEYALEAERKATADPQPKPFGTFGANAAGLQDLAGNVWEWTDTCHVRQYLDAEGQPVLPPNENCGVRVVAGSHYSLITDFIRDPKSGACSVGIPPSNLGIRLVLDAS